MDGDPGQPAPPGAAYETNTSGVSVPPPAAALQPGARLGQYELIRELGRGGMGVVWLARDPRLGRRVAVKVLWHGDPALAERFLAEARVTARCKHDNIVDIFDVGEAPGCSYMVLEYLEGVTLREWLRDRWQPSGRAAEAEDTGPVEGAASATRVPAGVAAELMAPVVRALAHAHGQGLVHRDLKPENVMLAGDGSVKVLDFGIARVLDHLAESRSLQRTPAEPLSEAGSWTRDGALVGTLPYMSPEQWGAGEIDARTDVWAVGIMLWELCAGRHPLAPLSRERLASIRDLDLALPSLAEARPQLGALGAVADRCLRKRAAERTPSARALLEELEPLLPGRAWRQGVPEAENPFVGLAAFQRSDAARFFGRGRDIAALVAQLRHHALVTVAGASGAGKSSLIRAGLIPALERSGQAWESLIVRPGRQPLSALADVLADLTSTAAGEPDAGTHDAILETLRRQPGRLGAALRARCQRRHSRLLLFVDQFEELYTLGADRETREAFVRGLEGVADDASSPLRVVLSVRSDFLDRAAEDRAFMSAISRSLAVLSPLSRGQLREAVVEPLAAAGHAFESEATVAAMLDSLESTRSPLPLLQFTAARLWEGRDAEHRLITARSYEALGGVEGALATRADAVLAALPRDEQRLARVVFTSLVSGERTRAVVGLDELRAGAGEGVERVVQHLAEARLVLVETDPERGATVELIHESLIERWPTLVRWLDEDQDAARFRSRVQAAARQWDQQGRSDDFLWRGEAAVEAERWLSREREASSSLGPRDEAYLRAVVRLASVTRRRGRRLIGAVLTVLVAAVVSVSLLAIRARREAEHARVNAVEARNGTRLVAAREIASDPTLSVALLRELEPAAHISPQWSGMIRAALGENIAEVVLSAPASLTAVSFSPDGRRIVTGSGDSMVRVWSADGRGEPLLLAGHQGKVFAAAFSPDGRSILTGGVDTTARIWTGDGFGAARVLQGHTGIVQSVGFSPDGRRVLTGSADGTARVWDASSGELIRVLPHPGPVYAVAYSQDGGRMATGGEDAVVRIWSANVAGEPLRLLRGHEADVYWIAFSADGRRLVTASADRTARVWSTEGAGGPVVLAGHGAALFCAAFSPDGRRVVTASRDKTARIWSADGGGEPWRLAHRDEVFEAAFSPDGARIATVSQDRSLRIWSTEATLRSLVLPHPGRVFHVNANPRGDRLITTAGDGKVRVWSTDSLKAPLVLPHPAAVYATTFSADGARIVTAGKDKTLRFWRTDEPGPVVEFKAHDDDVFSAIFSADGTRVVSASADRTARVWTADATHRQIASLQHEGPVDGAVFSRDGQRILTRMIDNGKQTTVIRVWRAAGPREPFELRLADERSGPLLTAFSPDESKIVASSSVETRVWNADGSGQPLVLRGVSAIGFGGKGGAFDQDGQRFLGLTSEGTLGLWRLDGTGQPIVLRVPDVGRPSLAVSGTAGLIAQGTRLVTSSRPEGELNPVSGKIEHWVKVWPEVAPFAGLDDPVLWTATTYCPPVDLRVRLLGVSEILATEQFQDCQARVAAARRGVPHRASGP